MLRAGVRAEEGMAGRLIIAMGATAWGFIGYSYMGFTAWLGHVCSFACQWCLSEHPTISITMLSELQAATGNGGHNVMVYGTGDDLPYCGVSLSAEYP